MEAPNSTLEYYIIHYIHPYDFYFKLWFKFYHWWMDMWCERQTRWAPRFVCVWRGVSNYRHYAAMYWDGKDLGQKLFFFVLPYLVLRELGF